MVNYEIRLGVPANFPGIMKGGDKRLFVKVLTNSTLEVIFEIFEVLCIGLWPLCLIACANT